MGGSSFLYLKREDCNRVSVCRENLLWRKIDRTARLRDSSGDIQRFNRKTVSAMLCPANNAAVADGRPGMWIQQSGSNSRSILSTSLRYSNTHKPTMEARHRLKSPYRFTLHCLEPAQASRRSVLCLRLQLSEYTIPRPLTRTHEKLQAWTLSQDYYWTKYKQVWCLVPIRKCRGTDFKS